MALRKNKIEECEIRIGNILVTIFCSKHGGTDLVHFFSLDFGIYS